MRQTIDDETVQATVSDIYRYMSYLRDSVGLRISVHQIDAFASGYMKKLVEFNNHECPYCLYMKQNTEVALACVEHQHRLVKSLPAEPFFGTCWLGVGEYVFPLCDSSNMVIGFISVSGYRGNEEKTKVQSAKVCEKFGFQMSDLLAVQKSLETDIPSFDSISVLVKPLCYMFSVFQRHMENVAAGFFGADLGRSNTFSAIVNYLRTHFSENLSEAELAKRFAISESTLSRMFRMYTKSTYRGYVNTMRVRIAGIYLATSDISIRELSSILGYSDANYFSTVFRKIAGLSPEKYREQQGKVISHSNMMGGSYQ